MFLNFTKKCVFKQNKCSCLKQVASITSDDLQVSSQCSLKTEEDECSHHGRSSPDAFFDMILMNETQNYNQSSTTNDR